jgi:hypothetical protein
VAAFFCHGTYFRCHGTVFCHSLASFGPVSMRMDRFFTDPSSTFFARVLVRVRIGASYMVLPSFPWRAPSFVPDGRRVLFPRVPVFCPCTRPCTSGCLVHGFARFSMARAQFRPRRASGIFFRVPVFLPVYESVPRTWFCPVLHGARPVSSTAGVGHFVTVYFVPVYPSLMLLASVLATGLIG